MSKIVCKKCVLDSDIPGITINQETGLCHFCETYAPLSSQEKTEYLTKIEELFKEYGGRVITMLSMRFPEEKILRTRFTSSKKTTLS